MATTLTTCFSTRVSRLPQVRVGLFSWRAPDRQCERLRRRLPDASAPVDPTVDAPLVPCRGRGDDATQHMRSSRAVGLDSWAVGWVGFEGKEGWNGASSRLLSFLLVVLARSPLSSLSFSCRPSGSCTGASMHAVPDGREASLEPPVRLGAVPVLLEV
jgi:hypothetical protein